MIDVEKLVIILRLYREDVQKISDPYTIEEERQALCTELTHSLDKLILRLNDKRVSVAESNTGSTQGNGM